MSEEGNSAELRLHIGGEEAREGWKILNIKAGPGTDYVGSCSDLGRFADGSVSEIYASHVLEHLGYTVDLPLALREFYRVLRPGGRISISVPDFDVICRLFVEPGFSVDERFLLMRMAFGGQTDPYDFHHVGLTYDFLAPFLGMVGFRDIERVDEIGLFNDTSSLRFAERLISLNVIAYK